jgi:hypothetical protein
MRTITTAQRNLIKANANTHHLKVEVQDADGTWQNLSTLGGVDWLVGADFGEHRDQTVATAQVTLIRAASATLSLAPLMTASTINRNAALSYAPMLDLGRGLRITTAITSIGTAPVSADWKEGFNGRIDDILAGDDPIVVDASSLDAWLFDTQIETKRLYGSNTSSVTAESQMQQILTDNPDGGGVATLSTPTSPGWYLKQWTQDLVKVGEALRALSLQIGFDTRYRYNSSDVNHLTFYDPLRTRSGTDDTIGPTEYSTVKQFDMALVDIRNVGSAPYIDSSGVQHFATQSDATSISRVRRRFFSLDNSININGAVLSSGLTDAQTLINAAVNDMSAPGVDQQIDMLFYWPVQVYDRYTFSANGDHYDSDQILNVVGYRHTFRDGHGTTSLLTSGKASGAYAWWLKRVTKSLTTAPILPTISTTPSENGSTGTLKLTIVDPQARVVLVEYVIAGPNTALPDPAAAVGAGWTTSPAPTGNVYAFPSFSLEDTQLVRVAYRVWGDIGGGLQVIESDVVKFGLGAVPSPPDVSFYILNDGTLSIVARGDSDTAENRFVVSTSAAPTDVQIDAATSVVGRISPFTYGPLNNGDRYFIGVKSYNTNYSSTPSVSGSSAVQRDGQWTGPTASQATVLVGSSASTASAITFNGIVLGPQTTDVIVSVREYVSTPGTAPASVAKDGYHPKTSPLKRDGSITIPVAIPGNYLVVTFSALDSLNRAGSGSGSGFNAASGEVTVVAQSLASPPATPVYPPTSLTLAQNGTSSVDVSMVMPGSTGLPYALRILYDGVALTPDVLRTAAASGTQVFNHAGISPGSTHSYQVFGVDSSGVVSSTGTSTASITLTTSTIPTPSIGVGGYDDVAGGFPIDVYPGTGSPSGVTWTLRHHKSGFPPVNCEVTTATSFTHLHASQRTTSTYDYISVVGNKSGWTSSSPSSEVSAYVPVL